MDERSWEPRVSMLRDPYVRAYVINVIFNDNPKIVLLVSSKRNDLSPGTRARCRSPSVFHPDCKRKEQKAVPPLVSSPKDRRCLKLKINEMQTIRCEHPVGIPIDIQTTA